MEKFQKICAVVVLTFALALSTFASDGDIGAPGAGSPPHHVMCLTGATDCPDETPVGDRATPDMTALDPVTEAALSLLQSIFSLF